MRNQAEQRIADTEAAYSSVRIAVPTAYADVFSHFYFAENNTDEVVARTLLPSYQTILVFCFGKNALLRTQQNTPLEVDKCLVLGPIKKAFDYALFPQSSILVANFKHDGFYRFFGTASIGERPLLHPDELLEENCFTALWAELNQIPEVMRRVDYMLDFCKPYLGRRNIIAERLANFNKQNLDPIKAVANEQTQTERNIQLHHKKHFGYSAKELNRYRRFLSVIERIQVIATNHSRMDWFEVIDECGYYDQSQLIHDFKYYLNMTPVKYLEFQQDICNPMS
ncbi:AraC family transcriptional regulator [Parapedobacter sp. ISTM3]|uniref:AraC family transcriptional regulator n=1 Tax=Parapedobacter sp. ISTM3 TaxID=2800130 RepID=UPI00190392B9|nr:AraC family transcriptional regulator [Parapedobacter sp. ISTM3]MBK1440423.1 AraC family transcriptional regulator [Parapedobacter sp. ISTM3]